MNKSSFFDKYDSFECRVKAAIDKNDVQLVQILLGHKYCQLWQLWLVNGIITTKLLNMEKVVREKLMDNIVKKQLDLITDQKYKLRNRKEELSAGNIRNNNDISNMEQCVFVKTLFSAIRDSVEECRDGLVQEMNISTDYRQFYIPANLLDNTEINNSEELNCLNKQIDTISAAGKVCFEGEVNFVLSELSGKMSSDIWNKIDLKTCVEGALVELSNFTKSLEYYIENNQSILGPFSASVASSVLTVLNGTVLNFCKQFFFNYDSVTFINEKLCEVDEIISILEDNVKETNEITVKIENLCLTVKNEMLDKLNDGKFIDKEFVRIMYTSLLHNYLDKAKSDESNLLYYDIKNVNDDLEKVAEIILKEIESVDHEEFGNILHYELTKENPNFNIISLFIINSTPLVPYKCSDNPTANKNMEKLMKKSYHGIMLDVNSLLFNCENNSYPGNNVKLLSQLPNRRGEYCINSDNMICLHGNKYQQDLIRNVDSFSSEIGDLIKKGGLNRVRGYLGIPYIFYFFKDLFFKSEESPIEDQIIIYDKIKEFFVKISHSNAIGNESLINDYMDDIKERLNSEENSDIRQLYNIILKKKKYFEHNALYEQSIEYFIKFTDKRIRAFKIMEEMTKTKQAEEELEKFAKENDNIKLSLEFYQIFPKIIYSSGINENVKCSLFGFQEDIINLMTNFLSTMKNNTSPQQILERFVGIVEERKSSDVLSIEEIKDLVHSMKLQE